MKNLTLIALMLSMAGLAQAETTVFKSYHLDKEPTVPALKQKDSTVTTTLESMKVPISPSNPAATASFGASAAAFARNSLQTGFAVATLLGLGYTSYQLMKIFKNWWYEKHKTAKNDPDYEPNEKLWAQAFLGLLSSAGTTVLASVDWNELSSTNPYKEVVQNTVKTQSSVKNTL